MDFYTTEEVRVLLDQADGIARPLLMTAVLTGMRRNELLALRWGDIDWKPGQIRVRQQLFKLTRREAGGEDRWRFLDLKSRHSRRAIDMTPELRDALELHRLGAPIGPRDLVFCRANGESLDPEGMVDREFTATARRARLRVIRFHDLRHTYAALQIAAGASPKYLQAQMGHSSLKVTLDLYGHLMPDVEREAARRLGALVFEEPSPSSAPLRDEIPANIQLRNVAKTRPIKKNQDKRPILVSH
jgi:integrase